MRALEVFEDGLSKAERAMLYIIFAALVTLAFLQVVLRFFSFGFVWADVLVRQLVLWAGFLGAAIAAREERHFAVDAVARLLPEKVFFALCQLGRAGASIACVCLAWASGMFVRDEWQSGSMLFSGQGLKLPSAFVELILPVSFLLIAFHFAMRLKDPPRPPEAAA